MSEYRKKLGNVAKISEEPAPRNFSCSWCKTHVTKGSTHIAVYTKNHHCLGRFCSTECQQAKEEALLEEKGFFDDV
ncbi:MAG: hypothetical protein Q8Q23_00530 [bacterium]|nr:hypothetical protein [bacterium]